MHSRCSHAPNYKCSSSPTLLPSSPVSKRLLSLRRRLLMDRRPPLPASPRRLRPRPFTKTKTPTATPPCKYLTPSFPAAAPVRSSQVVIERDDQLRPEYLSMAFQLQDLARRTQEQLVQPEATLPTSASTVKSMFQRGRMYDLYSMRRNERLKRRKGEEENAAEEKRPWELGVRSAAVGIKKVAKKVTAESARRSVDLSSTVARRSYSLRSSVRSGKEVKEASTLFATPAKSAIGPAKGVATRTCRRK